MSGKEKTNMDKKQERPLLYYKTKEQIEEYINKSVEDKLKWLEEQMYFFYYAMPEKAKKN